MFSKEVACEVGKHPRLVEGALYALAPQTGWREPNEHAEREVEDAVNLAGWLLWKQKGVQDARLEALSADAIATASPDTEKRAQAILRNYPELVPRINRAELEWPEQAKVKWRQIFGTEPPAPVYWGAGAFIPSGQA